MWKWSILCLDTWLDLPFDLTTIQTRQICRIWTTLYLQFCWCNNKMTWKPIKPRVYGQSNAVIGWGYCDSLTHMLSRINECIKLPMPISSEHSKRWYNAPTLRTEVLQCCRSISLLNKNGDAVVYLLLFPCGEGGWYEELQHIKGRRTRKHVGLTQLQ